MPRVKKPRTKEILLVLGIFCSLVVAAIGVALIILAFK